MAILFCLDKVLVKKVPTVRAGTGSHVYIHIFM